MSEFLSKDTALKTLAGLALVLIGWWQSMMVAAIRDNSREASQQFIEISKNREGLSELKSRLEFHTHEMPVGNSH